MRFGRPRYGRAQYGGSPREDLFPGDYGFPVSVLGFRKLIDGFSGNVVLIRRSSDNAEQGFTANEITDGTLEAWVGAGNDGFGVAWYDQTGNGNNYTQSTAIYQPILVSSGSLVTDGGKPAWQFNNSTLNSSALAGKSRVDLYWIQSTTDTDYILFGNSSDPAFVFHSNDGSAVTTINLNAGTPSLYSNGVAFSGSTRNDVHDFLVNGGGRTINVIEAIDASIWSSFGLAAYRGGQVFTGKIQALLTWNTDQSANREAIQDALNLIYGEVY